MLAYHIIIDQWVSENQRTRWQRQGVKNIMFEFESKICFIKNIVRWNGQDQVMIYLIKSDERIRRRPSQ